MCAPGAYRRKRNYALHRAKLEAFNVRGFIPYARNAGTKRHPHNIPHGSRHGFRTHRK